MYERTFAPRGIVEIERVVADQSSLHDGVEMLVVMRRWGATYGVRVAIKRRHIESASMGELGNLIEYNINHAVDLLWLGKAERIT